MEHLDEIITEYRAIAETPDLFSFWEGEFALRRRAGQAGLSRDLQIKEPGELDFLLRSLYFSGHPQEFWFILINNLHLLPVLQWLQNSPGWLREAFLNFLPWYISNNQRQIDKLQFLVNIYHSSYHQAYQAIVNVLSLELCTHLLSRTANPQLRILLRNREELLLAKKKVFSYGIKLESGIKPVYHTMYGDKAELIGKTLNLMQLADSRNFNDPYGAERTLLLLQAAEMLFHCGLPEDSLVNLRDIYEDYQENNRLVEVLEDEKIYQQFFRILRRVIPCYALLFKPNSAWTCALDIYSQFFPRLKADPPSLQYLNIYESIVTGEQNPASHIAVEILYKSTMIQEFRPAETPLLCIEDISPCFHEERLLLLQQSFQQKIMALPHEAFVTMEMLRLLHMRDYLVLSTQLARSLFTAYMQLWKWIPGRLFINRSVVEQLISSLDDSSRSEAERLLSSLENYDEEKMKTDLHNRPELFRKRSENFRRELFTGKFLGWL